MLDGLSIIEETYAGYAVTLVRGINKQELLSRFGGDPTHAWPIPCGDVNALSDLEAYQEYLDTRPELDEERFQDDYDVWNRPWIQVGQCGDWAFALERDVSELRAKPQAESLPFVID